MSPHLPAQELRLLLLLMLTVLSCPGGTVMRNRLLEARGWKVISIPWFEWRENVSLMAKQQYLCKQLPSSLFQR